VPRKNKEEGGDDEYTGMHARISLCPRVADEPRLIF